MSQLVFGLLTGCHVVLICLSCPQLALVYWRAVILFWSIGRVPACAGVLAGCQSVLVYWRAGSFPVCVGFPVCAGCQTMSVCRRAVRLYLSIGKLVVSQLRWSTGRVPHCVGLLAGSQRCVGLLVVSQLVSVYWRALRLCWSIGRVPVCVWSVGGLVYGGCCSRRFNSSKTCSGRDIDRLGKTASSVKASMLLTRSTFCTTTLAAWGQGIVLLQHKPWSMVPHKRRHAVPRDLVPVSQTGEELKCRLRSNDSIHRGLYRIVVK